MKLNPGHEFRVTYCFWDNVKSGMRSEPPYGSINENSIHLAYDFSCFMILFAFNLLPDKMIEKFYGFNMSIPLLVPLITVCPWRNALSGLEWTPS